jgi:NAD(P)H-nitrite reductase large subunit
MYSLADALNTGKEHADCIKQSKEGLNEILWAKADELVCYCRKVPKASIVAAFRRGAANLKEIQKETTACTGRWCKDTNPKKRCCHIEIEALIEAYSREGDDNMGSANEKN